MSGIQIILYFSKKNKEIKKLKIGEKKVAQDRHLYILLVSNLSSTETIFKESTKHCENNLRQSGYNEKLTYKPTELTTKNIVSINKRKIIWFNPPFSKSVSTIIGKLHELHKLQLHAKHKICYKQPQYESFKQYR